ncbi:uncharacterized protein METZ01_LOCUS428693, partial [marine metagenome]
TIVSRPSIIDKISEIEMNSTNPTIETNQTILVIIGVERKYSEYDSKAIYNFVKEGGKVVLAGDSGYANSAFYGSQDIGVQWYPIKIGDCKPTTGDNTLIGNVAQDAGYADTNPSCKPARLYDSNHWDEDIHPKNNSIVIIDADIDRMNFEGQLMMSSPSAIKIQSNSNSEGLAYSTQEGFIDYNGNGQGDCTPRVSQPEVCDSESTYRDPEVWGDLAGLGAGVIAEANIGEGKVILISDTSIFTNLYYEKLDNKEFIVSMFEYLTDG